MVSIDEKRIYADKTGRTRVFVGTGVGVATVSASDDLIGEFGIEYRCRARDIAGGGGRIAVATDEDVALLGDEDEPADLGFGPADAIGFRGDALLAAAPDGRIARATVEGEWTDLATVDAAVRAIDDGVVATEEGVYRLSEDDLQPAGLDDARDVAASDAPLAATGDGVYRLGAGWMEELSGSATLVATDGDERTHAVVDGRLYARDESASGGDEDAWQRVELPVDGTPAGVAYGEATYVVTEDGTMLVDAGDGWRHQLLGLGDVVGCALAGA